MDRVTFEQPWAFTNYSRRGIRACDPPARRRRAGDASRDGRRRPDAAVQAGEIFVHVPLHERQHHGDLNTLLFQLGVEIPIVVPVLPTRALGTHRIRTNGGAARPPELLARPELWRRTPEIEGIVQCSNEGRHVHVRQGLAEVILRPPRDLGPAPDPASGLQAGDGGWEVAGVRVRRRSGAAPSHASGRGASRCRRRTGDLRLSRICRC